VSLLELQRVSKRYCEGELEHLVLREVSLQMDAGELAMVWGRRGSGRSTLLRIAAGIEAPDDGIARFDGSDLASHGDDVLGDGIGYCQKLTGTGSQPVLELVMMPLLAAGIGAGLARSRAREALERVGASGCAMLRGSTLDTSELVRVALARVLAHEPRLVVIDDPIQGVDLLERDGVLALLRSLTADGVAVLASTTDATGLSGADRVLTLMEGELRGPPPQELAPVLELHRRGARQASA
jgi:ABC-type lipoprotein export system ATPase subunit